MKTDNTTLKKLTRGEEEVMQILWQLGAGSINDPHRRKCRSPNRNIRPSPLSSKYSRTKATSDVRNSGKSYEYYPLVPKRRVRQDGCFFDIELPTSTGRWPKWFLSSPGEKTFRYKKPNKSSPSSGKPDIKPTSHERDRPIHPRNSRLQRHTVRRIPAVSAQLHGVPRSTALPHGVAPRGGSHSLLRIPVWPGKVIYATAGTPAKTTFTAPSVSAAAFDYEAAIWIVYGCGYFFYSLPCSGKRF